MSGRLTFADVSSRLYWALAPVRRGLRLSWHRLDKQAMAVCLLVGLVLGGLGFGLRAVFTQQDLARERAREAELQDLACLARNVYFEARGEPEEGQYAVAEVTMNRKASILFPDTVCGVVHEKRWDAIRRRYVGAFSWTEFNVLPEPDGEEWERAWQIAEAVYYRREPPQLQGVLHFHARHIRPSWAREKKLAARIGRHVFYR
jgi:spore germination cell wall hydrolase CwlJ-like protein